MERAYIKRIIVLVLGIIILSSGIALFIKADLGCDPYTTLNLGVSSAVNYNFAIVQIIINLVILAFILAIDKSFINIGTIISLFCVGPLIECFTKVIDRVLPYQYGLVGRVVILITGCLVVAFGVGVYIAAGLGVGPYDILPLIIEKKKSWPYKWIRITLDISCAAIGVALGETIGIGTIIAALGLGPGIEYFRSFAVKFILKQ
ncbi:MAG: hypothetical protein RR448_09205 [Niameybacter sp.]|uniref:YczE/YyaS/YitT family protein n=1 Tax=Niameybacter sp. TaxID=2033640 RepID=UPI002FCC839E